MVELFFDHETDNIIQFSFDKALLTLTIVSSELHISQSFCWFCKVHLCTILSTGEQCTSSRSSDASHVFSSGRIQNEHVVIHYHRYIHALRNNPHDQVKLTARCHATGSSHVTSDQKLIGEDITKWLSELMWRHRYCVLWLMGMCSSVCLAKQWYRL